MQSMNAVISANMNIRVWPLFQLWKWN